MTLPDFTERCRRHNWLWSCETHPSRYNPGAKEEAELMQIAYSKGSDYKAVMNHFYMQEFRVPLFKNFPVANVATEQPKPKDTMNLTLNITADSAILEALNNIASALKSRPYVTISGGGGGGGKATSEPEETQASEPDTPAATEPEATPAPKARKPRASKATQEPAPAAEPDTQAESEPAPVAEPAPATPAEPDAPTGEQLLERVKEAGLVKTQWSEKLRDYMDKDIGLLGVTLKAVTDPEKRRLIDAKITELIAAKAEDL